MGSVLEELLLPLPWEIKHMAKITIIVTLEAQDEAVLRERAEIVSERIRSGMFGCDVPDDPNAWKFFISQRSAE